MIRRLDWSSVIVTIAAWLVAGGITYGALSTRVRTLEQQCHEQRKEMLQLRQTISEQLVMISEGMVENQRMLEVIQAEQRILHRDQLGRLQSH